MYACIDVCMYVCVCECVRVCVRACVRVCVCVCRKINQCSTLDVCLEISSSIFIPYRYFCQDR